MDLSGKYMMFRFDEFSKFVKSGILQLFPQKKTIPRSAIYIPFSLIINFYPQYISAQNNIPIPEILMGTLSEKNVELQNRPIDFLKNTDHELPWVNKMEVRTETDELDWERQEYLLRLSLNSTEERAAQKNIHEKNIELAEMEKAQVFHEQLVSRYFLLAEYFFIEKEIELINQNITVANDQLNIFRKKATATGEINLPGIISAEEKIYDLEQKLLELNGDISWIKKQFGLPENDSLIFENIPAISFVQNIFSEKKDSIYNSPEINERQIEIEKKQAEYDLEKVQNGRILDFVQMKYSGRDNLNVAQEISFGMGFNIPYKSQGKLDLNELILEKIEEENRLETFLLRRAGQLAEVEHEMDILFEKHEFTQNKMAESQALFSKNNYPEYGGADPLVLLKIKESELNYLAHIFETEKDIFEKYIEWLDLSGIISQRPLRNYLSENMGYME